MEPTNVRESRLNDLIRLVTNTPRSTGEKHIAGACYCCGTSLIGSDRMLICASCGDPNGAVARVARMLR